MFTAFNGNAFLDCVKDVSVQGWRQNFVPVILLIPKIVVPEETYFISGSPLIHPFLFYFSF